MMNRLFFFFVIFNFTNNLYSQSLSSNVLANSGDFVVNENSVSSTIGESLVFTNSQNKQEKLPLDDQILKEPTMMFQRSAKHRNEILQWSCRLELAVKNCF